MTTENIQLARGVSRTGLGTRRGLLRWSLAAIGVLVAAWTLSHALTGVAGTRVGNPSALAHLKAMQWAGLSLDHFWIPVFYGVTAAVMLLMIGLFVRYYRRTGTHHAGLPIFLILFLQILMDPLYNWAMYCNYYTNLIHWPVNWSVFNVAPTIEPLWIVMGAYQVFFLGPAWGSYVLYRRYMNRRAGRTGWIDRHPMLVLFLGAWAVGAVADILMEQWMLNMYIYKYTQIGGPSITLGHGHLQIAEIVWIGFLIAVCALFLHRDDRGETVGTRISQSVGWLRRMRVGAPAVAMMAVTVALLFYGGFWTVLRLSGGDTHIASGGWPYTAARTYDPNGELEAAGVGGPNYFTGTWCTFSHCGKS